MSHIERVPGSSPSDPKGKERSSVNPDSFRQFMVEKTEETDTESRGKKKRKRIEEEIEEVQKVDEQYQQKKTAKIAKDASPINPQQQTTNLKTQQEAPKNSTYTPIQSFNPQDVDTSIEEDSFPSTPPIYKASREESTPPLENKAPSPRTSESNKEPSPKNRAEQPQEEPYPKREGELTIRDNKEKTNSLEGLRTKKKKRKEDFASFLKEKQHSPHKIVKGDKALPSPRAVRAKQDANQLPSPKKSNKSKLSVDSTLKPETGPSSISASLESNKNKPPEQKDQKVDNRTAVQETEKSILPTLAPTAKEDKKSSREDVSKTSSPLLIEGIVAVPPTTELTGAHIETSAIRPYSELSLDIAALITKMVGIVTVMHTTGITETTVRLNTGVLADSKWADTEITIKTFDTAPGEINIEFSGSPEALSAMEVNLPNLMAAFQKGNYQFVVRRCDFIFHRKEPSRHRGGHSTSKENDV